MLILNNNYASKVLSGITTTTAGITLCITYYTGATIPDGGIFVVGTNTANQYTGIRIAAGALEAGMRSVAGTPASLGALSPNTLYTITLTRDGSGNTSAILNGGTPVTKTVTPGLVSYNYYGIGTYRGSAAGMVTTTQGRISNALFFNRILTGPELAAYHAKNLSGIDLTTNLLDRHNLISNLNSIATGGTNLTFTDPESDPPAFDTYDPFAPLYYIATAENPTIGATSAITVVGYTTPVNNGTLDGIALTTANNTSITVKELIDGQTCSRAGTRILTVTNGTLSSSIDRTVNPPTGLAAQAIPAGFNTGEIDSIAYNFNPPLQSNDIFYFDPTKGIIGGDASYKGNFTGSQIIWHHENATKIVRSFLLITGTSGEIISITRYIQGTNRKGKAIKGSFIKGAYL